MKIKIYQINFERDEKRAAFLSWDSLEHFGLTFDRSIYDEVFAGDVPCENLGEVFYMFNMEHPAGYRGHSLSVSDVVEMNSRFYFCDSFGWKEINFE